MTIATKSIALEVTNLACGYGSHPVLSHITFSLTVGKILALLGPNGSGKSTLLKTLSGGLTPIEGEIHLYGKDFKAISTKNRAQLIGFVPQDEEHAFGFSVREVILMGRLPYAGTIFESDEDHEIAHEAMALTDCLPLQDKSITEISGGERQRVLIARALAQTPRILMLDEPNNHLDVRHVSDLRQLLQTIAQEKEITIVAAIHDLNFASATADEAIVIDNQEVRLQGNIKSVLNDPILDQVYRVRFYRQDLDGILRLLPAI